MGLNIRIFNHVRQNDKTGVLFFSFLRTIHNKTVLFMPLKRNSTVFIWIMCTQSDLEKPTIPSGRIHLLPEACSQSSSDPSSTGRGSPRSPA